MEQFSKIALSVYGVSGGIVIVLCLLYAAAGTLFFDNPNVSYSSFLLPIIGVILGIAALLVGSYFLNKNAFFIWSVVAGLPIVIGIIYGIYYFVTTPYK